MFWPDADETTYGAGDVMFSGQDTLMRNVNMFCDRTRGCVAPKGQDFVTRNLASCYRGEVLSRWTDGLSALQKTALRHSAIIEGFDQLAHQFCEALDIAMNKMLSIRHMLENARARKPIGAWDSKSVSTLAPPNSSTTRTS